MTSTFWITLAVGAVIGRWGPKLALAGAVYAWNTWVAKTPVTPAK